MLFVTVYSKNVKSRHLCNHRYNTGIGNESISCDLYLSNLYVSGKSFEVYLCYAPSHFLLSCR